MFAFAPFAPVVAGQPGPGGQLLFQFPEERILGCTVSRHGAVKVELPAVMTPFPGLFQGNAAEYFQQFEFRRQCNVQLGVMAGIDRLEVDAARRLKCGISGLFDIADERISRLFARQVSPFGGQCGHGGRDFGGGESGQDTGKQQQ
ncbi:hypothetical protein SDC9_92230 [bioreactor metagenome]|uniref:Uncharacterized protein n=1 Tax=bioreactor metagenome TaxID=1076179 RepID=A0A644ZXJ5_9ZZZZ